MRLLIVCFAAPRHPVPRVDEKTEAKRKGDSLFGPINNSGGPQVQPKRAPHLHILSVPSNPSFFPAIRCDRVSRFSFPRLRKRWSASVPGTGCPKSKDTVPSCTRTSTTANCCHLTGSQMSQRNRRAGCRCGDYVPDPSIWIRSLCLRPNSSCKSRNQTKIWRSRDPVHISGERIAERSADAEWTKTALPWTRQLQSANLRKRCPATIKKKAVWLRIGPDGTWQRENADQGGKRRAAYGIFDWFASCRGASHLSSGTRPFRFRLFRFRRMMLELENWSA